ncbi:hypothetical protein B0T37_10140 [Chromobacterium violaceum]|uniref:hypothetical protein n=1 Tax=Chromobacterium violaceum TaxID=536 RepID=UPI0009DA24CD|nr:hypothetical protein [Chromobacterium violaceum]OQS10002.1 hypothetical protein B0T38_10535 [Chromobacterium violaceum]OQS26417.1 hypothetical protein B0T37_10140 [Chromobacterium violaceum]
MSQNQLSIRLSQAVAHLKSSGFKASGMQVLAYIASFNAAMEFYRQQVGERQGADLVASNSNLAD